MFNTIGLCLASRNRPNRFKDMYMSALNTADDPVNIFFSLRIDSDDSYQNEYKEIVRGQDLLSIGDRFGLCGMVNDAYTKIADKYDMYCPVSDDLIFRTPHWDTIVKSSLNAMNCPVGIVWGDGGTGRPKQNIDTTNAKWANSTALPTWFFVTQEWIRTIDYFLPPYFYKDYADTWYVHLISFLETHGYGAYVPFLENSLMIEHMHPSFGKAPMDSTYTETTRRYADTGKADVDRRLFDQYAGQRDADSMKLIARITELQGK